jgi:hypothetical protein
MAIVPPLIDFSCFAYLQVQAILQCGATQRNAGVK